MTGTAVRVEKHFRHPRERVFDAFLDPAGVDEAPDEPTRVTVTFAPADEGCVVVLSHDLAPARAAYADRSIAGWTMILNNLESVTGDDR